MWMPAPWTLEAVAYLTEFPQEVNFQSHLFCHLEALNAVVAIKTWTQKYKGKQLHLFSNSATAVAIF